MRRWQCAAADGLPKASNEPEIERCLDAATDRLLEAPSEPEIGISDIF